MRLGRLKNITVGGCRSNGSRPFHAYQYSIYRSLGPSHVYMLTGSRWPYYAVSQQLSRRCRVTTAGQPPPRLLAVAQGRVALYLHVIGWIAFLALLAQETKQKTWQKTWNEQKQQHGFKLLVLFLQCPWPITQAITNKQSGSVSRRV